MLARSLVLALSLLTTSRASLAETISEREVQKRAVASPEVATARQQVTLSEARQGSASLYPNPTLAWQREDFPGSEREDVFSVTLPIEASGRRGAARALVRSEAASARASEARTKTAVTVRALETFYAAVAAQDRVKVARATVTRLEEAARVLGERQSAGIASGYDVQRLQVALELAKSELDHANAESATWRAQLAFLLRVDETTLVLSPTLAAEATLSASRQAEPRALKEARAATLEAKKAQDSARSAWVPTVEVTGGLRVGTSDAVRYGYVAGVAVELPIWSRGQEVSAEARARGGLASAEAAQLEHTATLEQLAARQELQGALLELRRLRGIASERLERVMRAAESSYREGTRPLLEVLDAQRLAAELALRTIDVELRARRAAVRLRAARGELE